MKLFKIILLFFLIYFIRRFIQMYRVMKAIQQNRDNGNDQDSEGTSSPKRPTQEDKVVDADFKVVE
jgi:hypothetical protein